MVGVYTHRIFNPGFAGLAAGASAFAIFAMPADSLLESLQGIGASMLVGGPIGAASRLGVMAGGASLAFLISWLALRSCDPPARPSTAKADEPGDWPDALMFDEAREPEPVPATLPIDLGETDDPFVELARTAERVEAPLEPCEEQVEPENVESGPGASVDAVESEAPSDNGVVNLIQRLNSGLASSEWPLPPDAGNGTSEEAEDRLRDVLRDLKARARRG